MEVLGTLIAGTLIIMWFIAFPLFIYVGPRLFWALALALPNKVKICFGILFGLWILLAPWLMPLDK